MTSIRNYLCLVIETILGMESGVSIGIAKQSELDRFAHVTSIALSHSFAESFLATSKARAISCYTNGVYIVLSTEAKASGHDTDMNCQIVNEYFMLWDGTTKGNEVRRGVQGTCSCYDLENNIIWSYLPIYHQVIRHPP